MLKTISLILLFSFSLKAQADCLPVIPMAIGDKTDCPGFLFSPAKELELRTMNEDYKYLKEEVDLYVQQKELYKKELVDQTQIADKEVQKAELWRKQAEDSTLKLTQTQERQGIRDWLLIISGVALTVAAGYAVGEAHK